jgi:hypothetical protein
MPTQGHIKKTLADVQKSYEKCWALLKAVKTGDRSQFSPEAFFDFQPTLCSTLMDVDRLYREIEAKKKALITKKPRLSTSWFKKRMATLAHYQDVLLEVIKIGKFLGDSFAWFFYQKERGYLTEHLACKGQRHLPPGIGGLGEKEFVKNTKAIWGKLVIYHGTTTFLRMGDVSLIDLKSLKLVAIGELKSVQAGPNQMQVRVEFIGPKDRLKPAAEAVAENASGNSSKTDLSPSQRDRLRRQVKKIQEAISKESSREPDAKVSLSATIHADKLEQLVRTSKKRQFTYVQAGDGLVLGAYRTMATSLFGRLAPRNSPNWSQRF